MDKSETNIKMCEKAEEIQGLWKPQDGDWVYCKLGEKYKTFDTVCLLNDDADCGYHGHGAGCCPAYLTIAYEASGELKNFKRDHIWLPPQDQLQGMVEEKTPHLLFMALDIEANSGLAADEGWNDYWLSFSSMEQLWLAFVMKERYTKTWTGEDWI